jgi:fatty acid desaturase
MSDEGKPGSPGEEGKRELKIFLEFWLLIGLLAGLNLYTYFRGGSKMFLVVGIICVAAFIGWALFYLLYVRRRAE